MAEAEQTKRFVSIEDVVGALAAQCDGARRRDGRGFSRADAQEGGRLAALKAYELPWTERDARRARELTMRYAIQAGASLGRGAGARAEGIEKACRERRIQLADPTSENQKAYNYACLSPGGKKAYLWQLAPIDDFRGMHSALVVLSRLTHGERQTWYTREKAEISINGQKRRCERREIDMHGASWPGVIAIARKHGFLIEPALAQGPDPEIDRLRLKARSAWVHNGTRKGIQGLWAVFDLAARHDPFSNDVKATLRGRYLCDPNDDWNWFVQIAPDTVDRIRRVIAAHGFAASKELLDLTTPAADGTLAYLTRSARMGFG